MVKRAHRIHRLPEYFLEFTKGTTGLLNHKKIRCFLSGGQAVKVFLQNKKSHISKITADTSDFDFKFLCKNQRNIRKDSMTMVSMMKTHMIWFSKYLNRMYGFRTRVAMRELKGVPLNKIGDKGYKYKRVYKVYTFSILSPSKKVDLVDVSLVSEDHKTRFKRINGMYIHSYEDMLKDFIYQLASSFTEKRSFLRNPLYGVKGRKGLKDMSRILDLYAVRTAHSKKSIVRKKAVSKFFKDILQRRVKNATKNAKSIKLQMNQSR